MLRFFRLYNKYILAIGMSILMIAFLLPLGAGSMGSGGAQDYDIATIDGETLRQSDLTAASDQLAILSSINRFMLLAVDTGNSDPSNPQPPTATQWMLMTAEARQMGLSASVASANALLSGQTTSGQELVAKVARQFNVTETTVWDAVRDYVMVMEYQDILLGRTHMSVAQRVDLINRAWNSLFSNNLFGYITLLDAAKGGTRVSDRLVKQFVFEQHAKVLVEVVPVRAARYEKLVGTPTDEELQATFDEFKNDLPGTSEPFGFGYKIPDRVKVTYLSVPIERLTAAVSVEERDAFRYYEANRDEFAVATSNSADSGAAPTYVRPYAEVRRDIRSKLMTEAAESLGDEIIRAAQAQLLDKLRKEARVGQYYSLSEDYQPRSLEEVAQKIQEEFDILPDVVQTGEWLSQRDLQTLPGIGRSTAAVRGNPPFVEYVLSARELEPEESNPLRTLGLQKNVASAPMIGGDGSRYLFRITDAEPEHAPAGLDEDLRTRVMVDTRARAAYNLMAKDIDTWRARVETEDLQTIADEVNQSVLTPRAFPRRQTLAFLGLDALQVPFVEGVGINETFVDGVFDIVQEAEQSGGVTKASRELRSDVVPVPGDLTLYLVRVVGYEPANTLALKQQLGSPLLSSEIEKMLGEHREEDVESPFTEDSLMKRLNYKALNVVEDDDADHGESDSSDSDEAETPAEADPGAA